MDHAISTLFAATGDLASGGLRGFLIVLAGAAVVSLILGRLRLAAIPGYLIAGVLLGVLIDHGDSVSMVNSLAVVLLMFGIGLHVDLHALRRSAKTFTLAGILAGALATLALIPVGFLIGAGLRASIAIAMALSLSSTAVVLRILGDRRELHSPPARLALVVLLVQDLAVILMLAAVPLLVPRGADAQDQSVWALMSKAMLIVGAMGLMVLVGGAIVPRLVAAAARVNSEVMLVISATVLLGAAVITSALSLSAELGAFLAGLALASTPFRFQLAGQLAPIRDLFLAVFFTSLGMTVDVVLLAQNWWILILAGVLTLTIKFATISLGCWIAGTGAALSLTVGVMLAQGGEFSLVFVNVLAQQGVLDDRARTIVVGVVIATLLITPELIAHARAIGAFLAPAIPHAIARRRPAPPEDAGTNSEPERPLVLVIGYGPVGRSVTERLPRDRFHVRIIEINAETVRRQRSFGVDARFGDGANPEVLEDAGVSRARAVVVTIPDDETMLRICRNVRAMNPGACLVVRAVSLGRGNLARSLGATHAVVEEVAAAREMSDWVFKEIRGPDAPKVEPGAA